MGIWMNDDSWNLLIYEYAIIYEQLEILGWLNDRKFSFNIHNMVYSATILGSLKSLQWMKANLQPFTWPFWMWDNAAYYGHLDILKWFIFEVQMSKRGIGLNAQLGGHQHILDWLATLPVT
jgi:hypothetical protein